ICRSAGTGLPAGRVRAGTLRAAVHACAPAAGAAGLDPAPARPLTAAGGFALTCAPPRAVLPSMSSVRAILLLSLVVASTVLHVVPLLLVALVRSEERRVG